MPARSPVGWATSFCCPPLIGKKVKPQNTPSPNQLKASSQVGWANVFLFAHHFFNKEGGQEKDFAHPT